MHSLRAVPLPAVILAAGDGGRLGNLTTAMPKPLIEFHGRPLIDYTLEGLASAGVLEAAVVTGYRADQLIAGLDHLPRRGVTLRYLQNPRFEGGASLSLRAARAFAGDRPFLLVMSDHLLSAGLIRRLAGSFCETALVAADFRPGEHSPAYVDEATKLVVDPEGYVTAIGKQLEDWHALDTGAFVLTPDVWPALDAAPDDCELSTVFGGLARRRLLKAADVSGDFWYDIDTAADLSAAAERVPGPLHGV